MAVFADMLARGDEVRGATIAADGLADLLVSVVRGERIFPRGLKLRDCHIEGDLDLESLILEFPLYLNGCTFTGSVVLRHTRLKGIFLEGAIFEQVVDGRDMVVNGQIVMRHVDCHRPVLLRDCTVDGQLNLLGARFQIDGSFVPRNWMEEHAWGQALSLARSRLGSLKWQDVSVGRASLIDFTDLTVGSFHCSFADEDFTRCWPHQTQLLLDGIKVRRFDRMPVERLLRWTALTPDFSPSALRNIASALAAAGLIRGEETVMAAVRRGEVARLPSRAQRLFYRTILGISGYGLHVTRVLMLSGVSFMLAVGVATMAQAYGFVSPVSKDLIDKPCYYTGPRCNDPAVGWRRVVFRPARTVRYVPRDYPDFAPLRFTAELMLPVIEPRQRDNWDLSSPVLSQAHRLLAALALFFAGIFLATVSGLLKPNR